MASTAKIATGNGSVGHRAADPHDRWLKAGLVGAAAMTVGWWTLIACGMWRAIEWIGV